MDSGREIFSVFCLLCIFLQHTQGQDFNCEIGTSCDHCIRLDPRCAWCQDAGANVRCKDHQLLIRSCKSIVYPESDKDNKQVDLRQGGSTNLAVKLRSGQSVTFNVTIKRGEFPVDVYYLMDITASVSFQIPALRDNTSLIIQRIKNDLTPNVRIGLGQFSDKTVPPFYRHKPDWSLYQKAFIAQRGSVAGRTTCGYESRVVAYVTECGEPIGYQHKLSLSKNLTRFQDEVGKTKVLQPILSEFPRAQLDAIYQAVICEKDIGWSDHLPGTSIRLVIVVSDETAHFAGDGVIAGILDPMEEKCSLNKDGLYYRTAEQDFPSPGQVKAALDAHQVFVVVGAVTPPTGSASQSYEHYSSLSKDWGDGVALTAQINLGNDSLLSDVIVHTTTIASQQAIPSLRAQGEVDQVSGVDMSVKAYCPESDAENSLINGTVQGCRNMKNTTEATFEVTLKARNCTTFERTRNLQLYFNPGYGYVNITVDNICGCDCSSKSEVNSDKCNSRGNLTCGICVCGPEWVGKTCECGAKAVQQNSTQEEHCRPRGATPNIEICSGNGRCEINSSCLYSCICDEGFHGEHCQCNDNKCPRVNNKPCGGEENGKCHCAVQGVQSCSGCSCQCSANYFLYNKTQACCAIGNKGCSKTETSLVCTGNGECKCETCECFGSWRGIYCDTCLGGADICPSLCARTLPCLNAPQECTDKSCCLCKGKVVTPSDGETCPSDCSVISCSGRKNLVKTQAGGTYSSQVSDGKGGFRTVEHTPCPVREGSCTVTYYVATNPFNTIDVLPVAVDPEKSCSSTFNYTPVILGIVFGLLGLAILVLVIFKIVIHILDAREYRRFVEAQKNAKWEKESNPIFKSATQTFTNPEYKGGARR